MIAATIALFFADTANADTRPVGVSTDGGLLVLDLPLESARRLPDGTIRLILRGQLDGEPLGFGLEFHAERPLVPVDDAHAPRLNGYGELRSVGTGSNRFIALLARQFDLPLPQAQMLPLVPFMTVRLNNDSTRLMAKPVLAELFLHSGLIRADHERDCVVFMKIDVAAGVVQLREADVSLRQALLRVLTTA